MTGDDGGPASDVQRQHPPRPEHRGRLGRPAGQRQVRLAPQRGLRRLHTVRQGKGGQARTVAMSTSLKQALQTLPQNPDGWVLPYRAPPRAWRHITTVCNTAGVAPKGMHSLRHAAGTRLCAETHDLEETARHLGWT